MGKIILWLCLALSISLVSCNNKETKADESPLSIGNEKYNTVPQKNINLRTDADTLIAFTDIYPVGMQIYNDYIIVKKALSDNWVNVYDKNTLDLIWETGQNGQGPEDVIEPEFFANVNENDSLFQMIDCNDVSHIYLDIEGKKLKKTKLPKHLRFVSNVNLFEDYTVAATNDEDCMFYIYDNNQEQKLSIPFDIDYAEELKEKSYGNIGYYLACQTYANKDKNRIIVPHFFFDEYSVYDFQGNQLNKICLSSDKYDERAVAEKVVNREEHIGYRGGFVTPEALYILRLYRSSVHSKYRGLPTDYQLIQMDWDGNPLCVYTLDIEPNGGIFVDNDEVLYIITKSNDETEEETFYLIRMDLKK